MTIEILAAKFKTKNNEELTYFFTSEELYLESMKKFREWGWIVKDLEMLDAKIKKPKWLRIKD